MMFFQIFWVTYVPIAGLCLYLLAGWLKEGFGGWFVVSIAHKRTPSCRNYPLPDV
jgi:hypothetical protein